MADNLLYLDLLKKVLTDRIHNDKPARLDGQDWPANGFTMIGQQRLDNLQYCAEAVLNEDVPGDFLEAGVWKGGAAILLRAVLKAHNCSSRQVWLADSFQGLPPPKPQWKEDEGDTLHQFTELAISLDQVKENFRVLGLLDNQVQFIPGWFHETLKNAPVEKISLLRLDGDMYESTYVTLEALYDKVSVGGIIIVDDYGYLESCKKAVHDFLDERNLAPDIQKIDWTGVFWRKA